MAAILLFLLVLSTLSTATAQPKHTLSATTKLTSWLSPSRLFAFGFYREGHGFRVGIWLETSPNKTIVWTANRDDPTVSGNSTLVLTKNGLFLKTVGAPDIIISGGISSVPVFSASMLDSGNLVLYNSDYKIIWESFNSPTDTILGGQSLLSDNGLLSSTSETDHSTGRFQLSMQSDANLVLYAKDTDYTDADPDWSTGTYGQGNNWRLQLYQDGFMFLVDSSDSNRSIVARGADANNGIVIYRASGAVANNGIVIYRATIDIDGIFRLYSHSFARNGSSTTTTDWSALSDKCQVKNICGFNSYCTLVGNQSNCLCLPGYNFTDPDQHFKDCSRNFTPEGCMGKKENFTYEISTMVDVVFLDNSYASSSITKDECRNFRLDDCNCDAAMFRDGTCKKLALPLRYGRASKSGSTTTFIKVGSRSPSLVVPNTNTSSVVAKTNTPPNIRMVGIVVGICSVVAFSIFGFLLYKKRTKWYRKIFYHRNIDLSEASGLRSFSYSELVKATDDFKEEVGRGRFGTVYKGVLYNSHNHSHRKVAVKKLEKLVEEGEREFRTEMRVIGKIHHRNLVRLLGFCDEGSVRLLVYEFISNGSLANLLFKAQSRPHWNERLRIALDVARGLFYLHEECDPRVIHCDIKPQNILMDDAWTAKISDFGLAKLLMGDQTRTLTGIRGTRGYLAAEWHKNIPISVKTDVYSFGIVLLEVISCRRNLEFEVADDEIILTEWVYRCFEAGDLQKLLGEEDEVESRILDSMVKVGLWCIQEEPALRPSMKNVIRMLEGNMDIPIPPRPT